jgi:hypothetical protein
MYGGDSFLAVCPFPEKNLRMDFFVKDSRQSSVHKGGFADGLARIFWRVKRPSNFHKGENKISPL